MRKLSCVLSLCIVTNSFAGPTIIWRERFEDAQLANPPWTEIIGNPQVISQVLSFSGPTANEGNILELRLSSQGYSDVSFSGWWKAFGAGLLSGDHFLITWSDNGGSTWDTLLNLPNVGPNSGWHTMNFFNHPTMDNNPDLTFRFISTLDSAINQIGIYSLALTGVPIPEPTTLAYLVLFALRMIIKGPRAGSARRSPTILLERSPP